MSRFKDLLEDGISKFPQFLALTLIGPPAASGDPRRAILLVDVDSGDPVAIERFGFEDPGAALERLCERRGWPVAVAKPAMCLEVPARTLYSLSDRLRGRRDRQKLNTE